MKNMKNLSKRGLSLLLALVMCLGMLNLTAFAVEAEDETKTLICGEEEHSHSIEAGCYELICTRTEGEGAVEGVDCTHKHDETCGYQAAVEGAACGHNHDDGCSYQAAKDEVPCDCTPAEDGTHEDGCAYQAAVDEVPCDHEHGDCGYVEAVAGVDCTHEHGDCGYVEAVAGHVHTGECYSEDMTCTKAEHTHTEDCYGPEQGEFTATFDFETGTLTINGRGRLTREIVNSFEFTHPDPDNDKSYDVQWALNGYNATTQYKQPRHLNNKVKTLIIGEGITSIEDYTFGGIWPKDQSINSGERSNNRKLYYVESLVLPEGLTDIGAHAFESMGDSAESGLFTVSFPSTLERIGEWAFAGCSKLPAEFTIAAPNAVIEQQAFRECYSIQKLTIDGAKKLCAFAFENCSKLNSVEIKDVDTVGDGDIVFTGCANIESLTLTNVKNVGKFAFRGYGYDGSWYNLKTLTINGSDTVKTRIGDYAFYQNWYLTDVTMTNVEVIGKLAFYGAIWLNNVTLTNIGTIDEQAFYGKYGDSSWSQLKNVTIDGCETIGEQAFYSCYFVTSLSLDNIGTISKDAFYYNGSLESIQMGTVGTIGQYAFRYCYKLAAIDSLENVGRIDGFAFYSCPELSGLTVADMTKMGFNGNYGDVSARVQAILSGRFKLDAASEILDMETILDPENWDDGHVGKSDNWNAYDNGTQLVEQARWTNTDKTEAEVQVDAYYTAPKQMDFIFVADLSASMAQLGNDADQNSRFYDMQSKLLDVTANLLCAPEVYDCQVAIVTFGGTYNDLPGTVTTTEKFLRDADKVRAAINSLEPLYESTDYGLGMQEAQRLVELNKEDGRNTTVVFLSDGAPNVAGSGDMEGTTAAAAIKGLGASIYGVLHSPGNAYEAAWQKMNAVCDEVYASYDTQSFSDAMNLAFTAIYSDYTVTIAVNSDFENVRELSVSVHGGTASYDEETHTITWTINGMPFTKHTLTYKMSLTAENAARYGDQSYDANSGNAVIEGGAQVETPVLTRTASAPVTPVTPNPVNPDPVNPDPEPNEPVIDIPEEDVPLTDIPEEDVPLAELPDEDVPLTELPDEEVPLAEVPQTGEQMAAWYAITALAMIGYAALTLVSKKRGDTAQ